VKKIFLIVFALSFSYSALCQIDTTIQKTANDSITVATLSEVVVSGERYEIDSRRVPFSINSVSSKVLTERGGNGFESFAPLIPGLQVFGIGQGNLQLAVRGAVTERQRSNRSSTVSIYFDDIPIDLSSANPNFQLFDIDRIEFLKGPQGTLYGAGAETGALHIISKSPKLNLYAIGGGVDFSTTSGGDPNTTIHTTFNLPIKSVGAVRGTFYTRHNGGYLDNITTSNKNTNSSDIIGGRISAKFWLSKKLEATISSMAQKFEAKDVDWFNPDSGRYIRTADVPESNYSHNLVVSSTIKYHLNIGTISLILGYRNNAFGRNLEVGRYPVILGAQPDMFNKVVLPTFITGSGWSEELRFVTQKHKKYKLVSGIFFESKKTSTRQILDVVGMEDSVPNLPEASTFDLPKDRLYSGTFLTNAIQIAPYADITIPIKKFSIAFGLRWYMYKHSANIDYRGALQGNIDTIKTHGLENGFNPRLNFSYSIDSTAILYLQVAKGTRPGGANEPIPSSSLSSDLSSVGLTEFPATYGSDRVWNFEVGMKGLQITRYLTLSTTLFYLIYDDIQVTRRLPSTYSIVQNAGRVDSYGGEAEITFKPIRFLTLYGNLSYTNAKLVKTPGEFLGEVGRPVPYFPTLTSTISLAYEQELFSKFQAVASIEYTYTGKRETDFKENLSLPMDEFGVLNIRAGIKRNGWGFFVFGKNVTNTLGILDRTKSSVSAIPYIRTTAIQPRVLGFSISKDI
jgi:outer membrane receptor protein involved in Fe transport